MMAVRYADCTRRWHRNREASETRFAQTADASLSDFGTSDVSPSTGTHVKSNGNGNGNDNGNCNCRCAELTATVAARNGKSNGNCRCAEITPLVEAG